MNYIDRFVEFASELRYRMARAVRRDQSESRTAAEEDPAPDRDQLRGTGDVVTIPTRGFLPFDKKKSYNQIFGLSFQRFFLKE